MFYGSSAMHWRVPVPSYFGHAHGGRQRSGRRLNKSAKERRLQQQRSDTWVLTKLLSGLNNVNQHRGNRLNALGKALKHTLESEGHFTSAAAATSSSANHGSHDSQGQSAQGISFGDGPFYPWMENWAGMPYAGPVALPFALTPAPSVDVPDLLEAISAKLDNLDILVRRLDALDEDLAASVRHVGIVETRLTEK